MLERMAVIAPDQQAIGLFAGLAVTLVIASLVGYALKMSVAHGEPHAVIDNLNARIKTWWLIVSVVGIAFWLGRLGMTLLFLLISFAALREWTAATCSRADNAALAAGLFVILPVQYMLVYLGWHDLYAIFIPVCAFTMMPVLLSIGGNDRRLLDRAANLQWGLMLCVFCISHVPALLMLDIPHYEERNLLLVVFLIVVTQSSDVLQYIWGKLLGRRPLAPLVSPSKTWEGAIGGVATATALGAALYWLTPFAPWQAALMALAVNVAGILGGMVLSAIKREHGIKDWSTMIAGHGGMLDRVDSVVFAAPVFFHLTRYGWAA